MSYPDMSFPRPYSVIEAEQRRLIAEEMRRLDEQSVLEPEKFAAYFCCYACREAIDHGDYCRECEDQRDQRMDLQADQRYSDEEN